MQHDADLDPVDGELAGAELQQFRHLGQALQEHLQHRLAVEQRICPAASLRLEDCGAGGVQDGAHSQCSAVSTGSDDTLLQACEYSSIAPSCSSTTAAASSSRECSEQVLPEQPHTVATAQRQPPQWKQQVQLEKQALAARQKQAAAEAAVRRSQQLAQDQAASSKLAQQLLPFQVQHSQVSKGVTHKLQKSLSMILREAAAKQGAQGDVAVPAIAAPVGPPALPKNSRGVLLSASAALPKGRSAEQQFASSPKADKGRLQSCSPQASSSPRGVGVLSASHKLQQPLRSSVDALLPRECSTRRSNSSRTRPDASPSKQQSWATADAQTDAEVSSYLLDHWQQQHLETAAVVLQCAWRSRVARLNFGRYISKRHASVHAALQPAFLRWRSWARAATHHRRFQQQAALEAWRELLQLQMQLCVKVLKGLRRGVLSGDTPALMMWRLCTNNLQQSMQVRPSLGGMLASILMHKIPRMRQQECLAAWRQLCQSQAALRARAHKMLTAVLKAVQQQRLQQAVRFWRLLTACRICERLKLQLPTPAQQCEAFDAWLWRHERRQQLQQQAAGLAGPLSLLRCFVNWRDHVHKMHVMRVAWLGLLLHTPEELLRGGVSAFKANWREEQLHRRLLSAAVMGWKGLVDKNQAVTAVRNRIKDVAEARRKAAGLSAFRRFCRMSQLLSAAGVLKQWQARPLVLAHIHAWLHDTLHATFYLCWWRWKRRAVARLRLRAMLGLHMYRVHWLHMELAFAGWRKVTAAAKQHTQQALDSGTSTGLQKQDNAVPAVPNNSTGEPCHLQGLAAAHGSSEQPATGANADADVEVCADADAEDSPVAETALPVSLADIPVGHPWRPLLQRRAVLAPQGLRRLQGLRLGRAVKDLRELEGSFIVKDSNSGAAGLLCSRVFTRSGVSPGLTAMVTAQLPMDLLWRKSFPADKFWWQRMVGLVKHQLPHPDSWRALLTAPHSSSNAQCGGCQEADAALLQDFLAQTYSTAAYKCTCSRCPTYPAAQAAVVTQVAAKPAVDAAALMAKARLRLRAGLKLGLLQVPEGSTAASTAEPSPAAAVMCEPVSNPAAVSPGGSRLHGTGSNPGCSTSTADANGSSSCGRTGGDSSSGCSSSGDVQMGVNSDSSVWPSCWTCEDVAGLCRLAQAEELLETAVHLLLGIGADSSTELYDKLQQMARGQNRAHQGDLLCWLVSAALAQDSGHNHAALARARARDELLVATMELRERAMALHLHIPHKFTLNTKRERVDVRAGWAETISKVEQERDWGDSSAEEDGPDPREQLWAALLAQNPQQQPQSEGAQEQLLPPTQQGTALEESQHNAGAGAGVAAAAGGPVGAQAAVLALTAAAAAVGGPRLRASAAQAPLAPGLMLAQAPAAAGSLFTSQHPSRAHTPPAGANPQQQQHQVQQQLDAQHQAAHKQQQQQQEQAKRKQHKQHKQAVAAAHSLFGKRGTPSAGAGTGSKAMSKHGTSSAPQAPAAAAYGAMGGVGEDGEAEIFAGPSFLPLASLGGSYRSGGSTHRSHASTHRSNAAAAGLQDSTGETTQQPPGEQQQLSRRSAAAAAAAVGGGGSPAAGSSSGLLSAAAAAVQEGSVRQVGSTGGLAPEAQCADMAPEGLMLKAELESILTDLLEPLLGPCDATAAAAASASARQQDVAAAEATAEAYGGIDGARGSTGNAAGEVFLGSEPLSSRVQGLQGGRSAAGSLAAACADWVLQQQRQPAHPQGSDWPPCEESSHAAARQLPSKPLSAPSALQHQRHSVDRLSSSSSSTYSSASALSFSGRSSARGMAEHSSPERRAASAAANLQSSAAGGAAARSVAWADAAGSVQSGAAAVLHHQQADSGDGLTGDEDTAALAASLAGGYSQEPSWKALAMQQGLLQLTQAGLLLDGSQHHQQSLQEEQGESSSSSLSSAGGQSSGQELPSGGLSLPSTPSARAFWAAQQQQQQPPGQAHAGKRSAGVAVEGDPGLLPPIVANTKPGHSVRSAAQAAAAGKMKGLQQQQPEDKSQQQQQQQQGGVSQQLQHGSVVSWLSAEEPEVGSAQALQHTQDFLDQQQVLPAVAAALAGLQALQQHHPGSTQQQALLEGVAQALSLMEPSQLQQQVQLLLQAQRHSAAAALRGHQQQQQQQQEGVPIRPWGGEMQPPEGVCAAAPDGGVGGAAAVLSGLLAAPLATRVAFWRQVTSHQAQPGGCDGLAAVQQQILQPANPWGPSASLPGSGTLAHQLHQLAWTSILLAREHHQQQEQEQHPVRELVVGAAPMDALRAKLHTYLAAHMRWRQQQAAAPPLAPAEKWVTLEHEEQVLEFITSMTIAAHQQLLRRHTGLPPAHQPHPTAPFGSSSSRAGGPAAPATNTTAADDTPGVRDPALAAKGSRVDLSAARRILPTLPRRAPARAVPVYTVPRPDLRPDLTRVDPVAMARTPREQQQQLAQGLRGRLEPLEGWQTGGDNEDAAAFAISSVHTRCTLADVAAQAQSAAVTAPSEGSGVAGRGQAKGKGASTAGGQQGPQLGRSGSSIKSSESSWAG